MTMVKTSKCQMFLLLKLEARRKLKKKMQKMKMEPPPQIRNPRQGQPPLYLNLSFARSD
jgi:hypothetical protein